MILNHSTSSAPQTAGATRCRPEQDGTTLPTSGILGGLLRSFCSPIGADMGGLRRCTAEDSAPQ